MPETETPQAEPERERDPFRVSTRNDAKQLASAITKSVDSGHFPQLKAVGHGAVGQAVKAIAIARVYLDNRVDLACIVDFRTVPDIKKGGEMSLMLFSTFDRRDG